jgi:hypothetical protein
VENPFLLLLLSLQHCTTPYFPYGIFSIPCPFYGFCVVLQKNRGVGEGGEVDNPKTQVPKSGTWGTRRGFGMTEEGGDSGAPPVLLGNTRAGGWL